jgi:hypothetical protein
MKDPRKEKLLDFRHAPLRNSNLRYDCSAHGGIGEFWDSKDVDEYLSNRYPDLTTIDDIFLAPIHADNAPRTRTFLSHTW